MGKRNKIIGYPGTGKTSLLIKILKRINLKYPNKKITYCSFTNEAVNAARDRLGENDVPFGTIHSLAKRVAGIKGIVIHTDYRYCKSCSCPDILYNFARTFCSWYYDVDIELHMERPRYTVNIDGLWALSKQLSHPAFDVDLHFTLASLIFSNHGHKIEEKNYILGKLAQLLLMIGISRNSLLTDIDEIYDFIKEWQLFKKVNDYFEFNDLLVHGLDHDLRTDVLIIDEFQDLSALQYELINHWCTSVDTVIIAGDYNQSVYGFQGGSPDFLLNFASENKIVLNQTYRLPKLVLEAAKMVLQDTNGFDKVYSQRMKGDVLRKNLNQIDLLELQKEHGSVFVLARTNSQLKHLKKKLKYRRMVSDHDYGLYVILFKKLMEEAEKDEFRRLLDRVIDKDLILYALDNSWKPDRLKSRVEFKTIHSSKGLEADVVVLFDQVDRNGKFSLEEKRVWYVGMTRSRGDVILCSENLAKSSVYLKMIKSSC
ncbi:MAG: AAA family ATPase [Candidatus Heimdallarchaeota archaeon]|nr:AAA family ATPase [Candidatus Heimdallarchaeota archaeon]